MAVSQTILSNPNASESQRNYVMREMMRVNGVPDEKIDMMVKPTIEEMKAKDDLDFLNKNEDIGEIKDLNEDHWVYINIYERAFDTDAKYDAINRRMIALQMS
jgi:hypothetical protein